MTKTLILISLLLIILVSCLYFLYTITISARNTLFRGITTWSAKGLKIKYNKMPTKRNNRKSFLEEVEIQSKNYLDQEKIKLNNIIDKS